MSPVLVASIAGAIVAGGLVLIWVGFAPTYPALGEALRRLDPATARQLVSAGVGATGLPDQLDGDGPAAEPERTATDQRWRRAQARIVARMSRIPAIGIPRKDLNLLGRSVDSFLLAKVGYAAAGLLFFPLLAALLALVSIRLPIAVPFIASLAGAAGGFFLPDSDTQTKARRARLEVRRALCAYLDLAALAKAANYGAIDALSHAAAIGQGWEFARIREALTWAERHQVPPWTGLQRMAELAGIDELADIAAISRSSADGAVVFSTLLARSASLRAALLAEARSKANKASEKMTMPVVALALGFLALVIFAALARIIGV